MQIYAGTYDDTGINL